MIWAFIADSTVDSIGNINFDGYQRVIVFCSNKEIVKFDCNKLPSYCTVEFVPCDSMCTDSIEMNMAYQIGLSNAETNKEIDFVVISANRVFDDLCDTVRATGRNSIRKSTIGEEIDLKTASENVLRFIPMRFPDGRSRPRAESNLTGWIRHECESLIGTIEPSQIVQVFWDNKIIKKNVNGINYQLKNPINE